MKCKCEECGSIFKARHGNQKLCGSACVKIRKRLYKNQWQKRKRQESHAAVYRQTTGPATPEELAKMKRLSAIIDRVRVMVEA